MRWNISRITSMHINAHYHQLNFIIQLDCTARLNPIPSTSHFTAAFSWASTQMTQIKNQNQPVTKHFQFNFVSMEQQGRLLYKAGINITSTMLSPCTASLKKPGPSPGRNGRTLDITRMLPRSYGKNKLRNLKQISYILKCIKNY